MCMENGVNFICYWNRFEFDIAYLDHTQDVSIPSVEISSSSRENPENFLQSTFCTMFTVNIDMSCMLYDLGQRVRPSVRWSKLPIA